MKCYAVLGLFALLLSSQLLAQTDKDSLLRVVKNSNHDTLTINTYLQLCKIYQDENPDSTLFFALKAEKLAKKINDPFREIRAIHEKAVAYDLKDNLDSCTFFLNKADSGYTALHRFDWKASVLSDLGVAYYLRSKHELSLRAYIKAYDLMKEHSTKKDIAKTLNNMGLLFKARKEFDRAIQSLQSALEIKKEINDEPGILNTTINVGSLFHMRDMFDSAYYYASIGLIQAEKLQYPKDIIICKSNMGAALCSMGKYDQAWKLLQPIDRDFQAGVHKFVSPTLFESMANLYMHKGQGAKALEYFFKALQLAKQRNSLESITSFHKSIARMYFKNGDYRRAYLHLDTSKTLTDSVLSTNNVRQLAEMSAIFETNEKQNKIQILQETNQLNLNLLASQRKVRNYFILSTILFVGLSFLSFRAYRGNRRKNKLLTEQNNLIEKSLQEKEILLKEIHHRVKNNLQLVSSLLSLQSNYIDDEKALDAVRESKNRVQSMALIHQNLYRDDDLVNIEVKEYIEQLSNYLFHSYNIHQQRIALELDIDAMKLDIDILIPLGLILNELINNCLKYAFPDQRNGKIRITLKQQESELHLGIYDNGIGMQNKTMHFEQNSFGYKMINAFLKKMKGHIALFTEDGTKIDIKIPVLK